jgi:cytochrome c peroxidase
MSGAELRRFIGRQVGGIQKLMVPANDADLPQPRRADGSPDPFFEITEAKRYLGKQLFHDPVRMVRIRPEFGGVPATARTASCGSCHQGESASKAGTLINFAAGGEGRHYTDAEGNFIPRRRPRLDILPRLRETPLFPGDALVDALPTLTDIYQTTGGIVIGNPALGRKLQAQGLNPVLMATGRKDALDSVGRNAPGAIGAAFNNRLLLDGFAGEPDASPGGLNPFGHPAQENVALLLLDAHRLLEDQSAVLQTVPAFVKLFRDAFPEEAAQADAAGDMNLLINDITVLRATATFLRTTVTRDTPWDHFLAGDNHALTPAQRRGARLFFTPATRGGAACFSCHSGPMLNKQVNDPDVAGVGQFVEENFYNLGLGDHPIQALGRAARNDPDFRDLGRKEITGRDSDAFKFRVVTLRQLKDARFFFHNGSFSRVKDVVKYFNAGKPQDAGAAAAGTLSPRFTHPRGPGSRRGLGLSRDEVNDLTDFLENALYDPAFVHYDPNSPTKLFQLSPPDFLYSVHRPDLAALGAIDGRPLSGLAEDNDDPLSRRDLGLEFLDVTAQAAIRLTDHDHDRGSSEDVYRITNRSSSIIDTHLLVVVQGLPKDVTLRNSSGTTSDGDPYRRVFLRDGQLDPGESIHVGLRFRGRQRATYSLMLLSGQGDPAIVPIPCRLETNHPLDEIAPGVPSGFTASIAQGSAHLVWDPAAESDLEYFRVYRSDDPDFVPGPETLVHETESSSWQDSQRDPGSVYYKLTAVDDAGNESAPASSGPLTSADLPIAFALHAARPNPCLASARIGFDLPASAEVKLEVFDVTGRRVRTLANRSFPAGRHQVEWDGSDGRGGRLAAGVYMYRFRAGSFEAARRIVLLP